MYKDFAEKFIVNVKTLDDIIEELEKITHFKQQLRKIIKITVIVLI